MNSSKIIILLLLREGKTVSEIHAMYSAWYGDYYGLILDGLIVSVGDDRDYVLTKEGVDLTDQILSNNVLLVEKAFKDSYNKGRVHPGNNMNKDWEKFKKENDIN